MQVAEEFRSALFRVATGSRVHAVRQAAANALANLTPVEDVRGGLELVAEQLEAQYSDRRNGGSGTARDRDGGGNNRLHGLLLLLRGLLGTPRWEGDGRAGGVRAELLCVLGRLSEDNTVPWPCRQICEEICRQLSADGLWKQATCVTQETVGVLRTKLQHKPQIGLHAWAKSRLTHSCSRADLPEMGESIRLMLKAQRDGERGLDEIFGHAICCMARRLVEFDYGNIMNQLVIQVASFLDAVGEEMRYALYKLTIAGFSAPRLPACSEQDIDPNCFDPFFSAGILRDTQCSSSGLRAAAIRLLCCALAASAQCSGPPRQGLEALQAVAATASQVVSSPASSEDLRKAVAEGLCVLLPQLRLIRLACTEAKYSLLHSQVKLLQDEDPDVRLAAAAVFPNTTAYTAVRKILSASFLTDTFGSPLVAYTKVLNWLCRFDDSYFTAPSTTVRNPFLEAAVDVFEEPLVVIRQLEQASKEILIQCEQSDLEVVRNKINIREISKNALSKLKQNSEPEVQPVALAAIARKLEAVSLALWRAGCDSAELEPLLETSQRARQLLLPACV